MFTFDVVYLGHSETLYHCIFVYRINGGGSISYFSSHKRFGRALKSPFRIARIIDCDLVHKHHIYLLEGQHFSFVT